MALGYFDGASTPEQLARRRAELDFLSSGMGRAQNVGQGVGDILRGVGVGLGRYRANKTENAGIEAANTKWSAFNPFQTAPTQAPQVSGGEAFPNPAALPSQAPQAPPPQDFGGNSGIPASKSIPASALLQKPDQSVPDNSMYGGVRAAGKGWTEVIGPDGKAVRREGARNWRNHNPGNIEYGDFAKSNGAIGTDGRFAVFPSYEAGRKAKESLLFNSNGYRGKTIAGAISRYAPQFENDTGGYISQVAQSIGVSPNTPLASLNPQQRTAMLDAMQRVEGFKVGRETVGGQPVQVASNDPQFMPASAPPQDVSQETMQQPIQQPQQVAQGGDDQRLQWAAEMMNSQFLDEGKKNVAKMIFEQEMKKRDPAYKMQAEADQLGLEKSRLELDAMRNPAPPKPEYDFINGKDGSVFLGDKTSGSFKTLYGAQPDPVKPTADIQEYEYAKGQGFNGSFQDFQLAVKKAGASQVNIDQKAEGAFDKKLAEGQAETFNTMATDGMNARADIGLINQLDGLLQGQGGMGTGLAVAAGKWGIPVTEGMSDLQAADAIISKLVPTQRQPGSGSMSDRDVELFKSSLPSLWNQPGGNAIIVKTMRGLAQYKQQQGDIAQQVQMGAMSRQDAVKALKALPNPLAEFGKQDASGAPASGSIVDGYRFKGGDPSDEKNWEIVN